MPVITNARVYDKYQNDKNEGINGYVTNSAKVAYVDNSGFILSSVGDVDDTASYLYQSGVTGTPPDEVIVLGWEKANYIKGEPILASYSMNAKYGERINFSNSILAAGNAAKYNISNGSSLGSALYFCPPLADLLEFNYSINMTIEGAYCVEQKYNTETPPEPIPTGSDSGKVKLGRPTGTFTTYWAMKDIEDDDVTPKKLRPGTKISPGDSLLKLIPFPDIEIPDPDTPGSTISLATFGVDGDGNKTVLTLNMSAATSEEGFEYDPDNGQRQFLTEEIIAIEGLPWGSYGKLPYIQTHEELNP